MKNKVIHIIPIMQWDMKEILDKESEQGQRIHWSVRTSNEVLQYTKEFEHECWFLDKYLKEEKIVKKGSITYRFFPSYQLTICRTFSKELIKKLEEISKKERIIIHLHDYHDYLSYQICNKFKNLPIIGKLHGTSSPLSLLERRPYLFPLFPLLAIEQLIERAVFKNVSYFIASYAEEDYLSKFIKKNKIIPLPTPTDFKAFRPVKKETARKRLNLPKDKIILIYAGHLNKLRACDVVIDSFQELKRQHNIILMVVGASPDDAYYKKAKEAGAILIKPVKNDELYKYYSAADLYIMYGSKNAIKYNGMGVAPQEALACNIPIVVPNIEFITNNDEIHLVGENIEDKDKINEKIVKVISNLKKYKDCRKIAYKYFSTDVVIKETVKLYKNLMNR